MRPAKVPGEVVVRKVWASLNERMDSKTHLVRPAWLTMMREIHVCRQRIADAVNLLKAEGKIEIVDEKVRRRNRDWSVRYYKLRRFYPYPGSSGIIYPGSSRDP